MLDSMFLSAFCILTSQPKPWWQVLSDAFGGPPSIAVCVCTIIAAFIPEGLRRFTKREITYSVTLTPMPRTSLQTTNLQIVAIELSNTGNENIEIVHHSNPMEIDLKGRTVSQHILPEIFQVTAVIPAALASAFFTQIANGSIIQLQPFQFRKKQKFVIRFVINDSSGTDAITVHAWMDNGKTVERKNGFAQAFRITFPLSLAFFVVIWLWHIVANLFLRDEAAKELILIVLCTVCFIIATTWVHIRKTA